VLRRSNVWLKCGAAAYVIHTVGPIMGARAGRQPELLAACYSNALALAVAHRLRTLAFPAISTGVFCYPQTDAAVVSSRAVADFLVRDGFIRKVRMIFYTDDAARVFLENQKFSG
jgi:O-acetyl-ADP-ribose deacetylase (regulator of RNase III)